MIFNFTETMTMALLYLNDIYLTLFPIFQRGYLVHGFLSCSIDNASSGSGLFHVDVIVLDEVHYLSDIDRGTVWEEVVSKFFIYLFF